MSLQIKWRDGLGNQVEEVLDIDPGNASGQVEETLSSVLNKGLDRQLELKVATPTGQQETIVVNQEGCRQAYVTSDGQRYVTSDGQVYGVLKNPCLCPCLPSDKTTIAASYITLDQTKTDPAEMISGDVNGIAIRWIRCNSHRVLGKRTADGVMSVCRLNDNNSNYFHDGAEADLTGGQGDVFMRLPQFFYHAEEIETDVWKIGFSPNKEADDWKEWDGNDLIGVYKAYYGTELESKSGVTPSGYISQSDFKTYAQARGTGYSLVKWKHHSILAFLFYAMYGNTDCQSICGNGPSATGEVTGNADSLGMTDTVAGENGNYGFVNFWGLENWWGDLFEFIDNVSCLNQLWTITEEDGSTRNIHTDVTDDGFISNVYIGENLDMIPRGIRGSYSTGFCDYYDISKSTTYVYILTRANNISSISYRGVAGVNATGVESLRGDDKGSRLAFRGTINEIDSSTEFMAIQALS